MKLLICTGIYPPDIGGPATYTKLIQEELTARGHEVSVLTYGESITNEKLRITNISRSLPMPLRYIKYFLSVLKLGRKAEVMYVQDSVSAGLPATLANLFLRKKMILKVVGDYAWEQASQIKNLPMPKLDSFYPFEKKKYPCKIKAFQKIQTWVAKLADKIITPSFYLKKILTEGWGMPEEKIKVIYNSFSIQNAECKISDTESRPLRILSVGRLVPWKGFDALIDIAKDISGAELEIVGNGPDEEKLQRQAGDAGLQAKIVFAGSLPHDEVIKKMRSADLFILNSSYEGLSHVILEAMACGLPIAVSRAGGNTELAGENEERGYLFDYNNKEQIKNKIEHIANNRNEAAAKAQKARDFVADFAKDKMIEKLEKELAG
jgi:glycosyltransferase involved in cell wall biosynthesis